MRLSTRAQTVFIGAVDRQDGAIAQRAQRSPLIRASYGDRDNTTGLRRLTTATGGTVFATHQSNSVPQQFPSLVSRSATLGFMDQRPA